MSVKVVWAHSQRPSLTPAPARPDGMETFYYIVFAFFLAATGLLEMKNRATAAAAEKSAEKGSALFNAFKNNYLLVYSLMMGAPSVPPSACL